MSLAAEWDDMSIEAQKQAVAKVQEDLVSIIRYVIDTTKEFGEGKTQQADNTKQKYALDDFFKYRFEIVLGMKLDGTSVRIEYEGKSILRVNFQGLLDGDRIHVQHRYDLEKHVEGTLNDMATNPDKYHSEYRSLLQQRAHEVKKQANRLGVFIPSPILP